MKNFTRVAQVFALIGAFFLAACAGPQSEDMYRSETPKKAPVVEKKKEPTINSARLAAIKAFGLDTQTTPEKLVGMSEFDVKRALGNPGFVRKDKGVEIWQYHTDNCILDLFLYESRDGFQVDHSELRGPLLESEGELSCFKTIVMGTPS
ncbi:hypothetical protein RYZ26_18945 [Terasakiella sp. A23]|uniref:hypothetical protein n=1 Tax=Terasakiella sp. FCG-A23 TaxID=3080561 RepID=UPI00295459F6|nr:hypothetical protein [Terasakiella sp. A23]MDV7341686.1 hypothetical protein [Terasakiella sp. A23]